MKRRGLVRLPARTSIADGKPLRRLPRADLLADVHPAGAARRDRADRREHRPRQGGRGDDRDATSTPYMGRAIAADGVGTALASAVGGSPTTTYAENIGVMAATRVYSTAAYYVAAVVAILFGLCPKFGAVVSATPGGVLGGITVVLYGMIGLLGAKIWIENGVDFGNPVNLVPLAAGIIIAIGDTSLAVHRQLLADRHRARHDRRGRRLPPGPGARPAELRDGVHAERRVGGAALVVDAPARRGAPTRTSGPTRPALATRQTGGRRPARRRGSPREAAAVRLPPAGAPRRGARRCSPRSARDGKVLAGGQSLVPLLSMRLAAPAHLVDINRLAGAGLRARRRRTACASARWPGTPTVEHDAGGGDACSRCCGRRCGCVAHPTIRNRGTTVGSLVHADPAAEMPAVLRCSAARSTLRASAGGRRDGRRRRTSSSARWSRRVGAGELARRGVLPGAAGRHRHGVRRGRPPARRLRASAASPPSSTPAPTARVDGAGRLRLDGRRRRWWST